MIDLVAEVALQPSENLCTIRQRLVRTPRLRVVRRPHYRCQYRQGPPDVTAR